MILVICEHDNKELSSVTPHAFSAAAQLGQVTALVVGNNCQSVAEQVASYRAVSKVLIAKDASFANAISENIAATILKVAEGATAILAASSSFAKGIIPWLAAKMDIDPLSDVIAIQANNTFKRPIYAGNAIATVQSEQSVNILTIRTTAFIANEQGEQQATIESIKAEVVSSNSQFVRREVSNHERPDLTNADIIVSGGRGVGSQENFAIIEKLADKLGAAIGASRAAVDAGFISNEFQVGQTGKIVAPKLYIAIGISGAIQHLAGMKDSQVIVAINQDADSAIFSMADYGLVGDLFSIVPELTEKV